MLEVKITELDLGYVKEYLKVDYDDEDTTLGLMIHAARSYIETMLGFKINEEWPHESLIPDELTIAALLLIAHWFDRRQMQVVGTVSNEMKFAVSALIEAHKNPWKEESIERTIIVDDWTADNE